MKSISKLIITLVIILLIICVSTVSVFAFFYLPNTTIETDFGSVNVSLKTNASTVKEIKKSIENYKFNVKLFDGSVVEVPSKEFIISVEDEIILNELKGIDKKFSFKPIKYDIVLRDKVSYDNKRIMTFIQEKSGTEIIDSKDAYIEYNEENKLFEIVPETYGNVLVDDFSNKVVDFMKNNGYNIDLVTIGCYESPSIISTDNGLSKKLQSLNSFKDIKIEYILGENIETLTFDTFHNWISANILDDGTVDIVVSKEGVSSYVSELNKKYTTFGKSRTFTTSTGEVVTLTTGDYGWWLDTENLKNSIVSNIKSNQSSSNEVVWKQKAACFGELDFSNSYVEVSISNQRVWMYVNGECVVDSPVVTGNIGRGMGTRKGVFSLTYKTKNAVLRGADYETPVKYWMPFDGGIGLHDATWRYKFGGNIYTYNGSHGCVNMPLNAAKTVYEHIDKSMPIIVW